MNFEEHNRVEEARKQIGEHTRVERAVIFFLEELDGYVIVISAVSLVLAEIFGWEQVNTPALVALVGAIAFRVYRVRFDLASVTSELRKQSDGVVSSVGASAQLIRSDIADLRTAVIADRLHEAEICDRPGFYEHMLTALRSAERSVDLTQLDQYAPSHFGTKKMEEYFALQKVVVREKPHVVFRRVVAIPTLQKLDWVVDVLEGTADCPNFQINVIDLEGTHHLPPPLSLQIFDGREFCLVDPSIGEMQPPPQLKMLWVSGRAAAEAFSLYYETVWTRTKKLKSGAIIHWEVLDEIIVKLEAQTPNASEEFAAIKLRVAAIRGRRPNV